MSVEIKPFTIDAYAQVCGLWQKCEGVGLSDADSREGVAAYLERNPGLSFVATNDATVVGAILCGHDGRRGYLNHLAVREDWRRHSIGRRLVESCLAALRRVGIQKCHIFVYNQNEAGFKFWKSLGWTPRGDLSLISKSIPSDN